MSIDEELFDANINEIVPNSFVSFRYFGERGGFGPPMDPKVSIRFIHPESCLKGLDIRNPK